MDELVYETELKGAALMAEIRRRMPGAAIDAVLDTARLAQLHQQARLLKSREFETVSALIEHLSTLSLTDEDMASLTRILEENRGTWISEKCAHELAVLLKNGTFKLKRVVAVQEPAGCFTWAVQRLGKRRPPCCCRPTSPDTGKPGTDP